jgi:hypothetical protein
MGAQNMPNGLKKLVFLFLVLAVSFLGGIASHWVAAKWFPKEQAEPSKSYAFRFAGPTTITCSDSEFSLRFEDQVRVTCGMVSGNPMLIFFDERGKPRTRLALDEHGSPYFALLNRDGMENLKVGYAKDEPFVEMKNKDGKESLLLRMDERGKPQLLMDGVEGQVGAGWVSSGQPGMYIGNEKRDVLWLAPTKQ